ncbi:uncharacterized protein TRIADDRAFT_24299 [Trichoplax adhaerens]|uniref:OTU domain-containing protein n=1 Tax=Trichoplax adhaerens TaxID=10228 RepID=B3RVL4_TRIAD|nr:hypothetical protein TRIADDRAFT_24299 [Trichoplax adhaerens]EDV26017.1 hypothetical protein TRIADDRAFT_24299 [Trichoplax adhaerens]|eukprot:XP_002112050.1 hypothetical protein TRIADDRAFT_24299 [Trichoplax adhaerens]
MAENDGEVSELQQLLDRHKLERKELQAKTQKLKHAVPKGDKKKKKFVSAEVAQLELELTQRHEAELKALKAQSPDTQDENNLEISNSNEKNEKNTSTARISRAEKRREKQAAKERERQQRITEAEAENINSDRNLEIRKFQDIQNKYKLIMFEVPPDGNCLYYAISDQLDTRLGTKATVSDLRQQTADYMVAHESEFVPFIALDGNDSSLASEEFKSYCQNITETAKWGGQLEILALSNVYNVPVDIYQANGSIINIGEQYDVENKIRLSFHQYQYALGNHYNSLRPVHDTDTQ